MEGIASYGEKASEFRTVAPSCVLFSTARALRPGARRVQPRCLLSSLGSGARLGTSQRRVEMRSATSHVSWVCPPLRRAFLPLILQRAPAAVISPSPQAVEEHAVGTYPEKWLAPTVVEKLGPLVNV